ncbi:NifB/NifX family molybdenum-iron cluster-binding protein [Desulfatitalea alkaliphila]|uniref:Dinitrogenase iron-molybdenum cofactor biosynthesis domain-containing protein n=1 Tax=Desulfatitalea alkaliphila TaxID=2929485 RepID=A0AA41R517_9BACT|nr:NifB/NifX family molybdenum-iron cluster-binding protein [Desulfatitalea alkaliphila]MCJ8501633.1 hypothetical protein [Desulfatitalea alkaliphila]
MKAAFAIWNDRIAPLFDTSHHAQVVEVVSGRIICQRRECFEDQTAVGKVFCLVEWGVGTLICGAISRPLQAIVTAHGIQVVAFVAGDLQDVTRAWLEGRVMEAGYAMPGHGNRCAGRQYTADPAAVHTLSRGGGGDER